VQLLVAQPETVLLHLVVAVQVLPVRDLERQPHRRAAELAREQRGAHLPRELEGLLGLDHGVDAVDDPLVLEHLAQQLGAAGGFQGQHLGGGGRARTHADAEAAGLDLLAGNVRIPEREDVARIGRAHVRKT
jgi:hypothetical protein